MSGLLWHGERGEISLVIKHVTFPWRGERRRRGVGMTWGLILAQEIPCQLRSVKEMCCLGNDLLLLELSEDTKKKLGKETQL